MRPRLLAVLVLLLLSAGCVREGRGQVILLDLDAVPLEDALVQLRTQASIDIVFAQRLVTGHLVNCRYTGKQAAEALACLLEGSGLKAELVRRRQYVLVTDRSEHPSAPAAPPRRGTLSGFVADAETGERLPGAHVYLTALRLGTATNDAGYFAIAALPPGNYRVRVSYLGYQPADVSLKVDSVNAVIRLRPVALESEGVLVEGSRHDPADLSTEVGAVALPVQSLERLPSFPGEQDLFQALQWLPGIHKSGELNGGLLVRGGEPDQNLYLLDGAPVYHPWHAFSLISTFQTETLKDVQLYHGAFPAEHGGRLSAVLDAQMKEGSLDRPRAAAGLSVLSGRLMVESPLSETSSFMISGRRSYLDQIIGREHPVEAADGRRDTLRTGYYFYDLSAKLTMRPGPGHRLTFSHYRGRDDLDLRLPFDLSLDFTSWLRPPELFFEIDQEWGNQLYSARYQYLYSRRFFLTTTAYYSGYQAAEGAFLQPTSSASLTSDYRVRLRDLGVKVDADFYHTLSSQMRAGVQAVHHRFRSSLDASVERSASAVDGLAQDSRLQAWELIGYVQQAWQPTERWQVMPGLRASFFSGGRYTRLNPSLNVRYALQPERFFLHAAAGTQVQYMHRLRDRYSFLYDLVSSRWIPTSTTVRPSSSVQLVLGGESYLRPGVTLTADVYWRASRDVLLPEDAFQTKNGLDGPGIEVGVLLGQYVPALARAYGVELAARVERGPWQVWLSYAGGRSLNRAPRLGETSYRPARFDVPRSFRGVVSYARRRWSFTVSTELRSGYPYTIPVARYAIGDPLTEEPEWYLHRPMLNNGRLPPYVRLDLTAGYRFRLLKARWQAQLHLYNATNHRNVIGRQYDPAQPVVIPKDRRGLPILPLFELELEL